MRNWFWALLALLVVAAVAIYLLPLRLVVPQVAPELTATAMTGSVWHGRLENARFRGLALGDLDIALDPRQLLHGAVALDFTRASGFSGRIGTLDGVHTAERLTGDLQLALPLAFVQTLDINLQDAAISVDDAGVCRSAGGVVTTRLDGIPVIGSTPVLQGTARCDQGALLLPLLAAGGGFGLDVHLWTDRRYQADLKIATQSALTKLALAAAGFTTTAEGAAFSVTGRL